MITQSRLKELLTYNPSTGLFKWRSSGKGRYKDLSVGGVRKDGYCRIMIDGKRYLSHRLAFLYIDGEMPNGQVDHIDHNPTNNALSNLRAVTHQENNKNISLAKNNTSGFTGVSWNKKDKRWQAKVQINKKTIFVGGFVNAEEANDAIVAYRIRNGFHKNHGQGIR